MAKMIRACRKRLGHAKRCIDDARELLDSGFYTPAALLSKVGIDYLSRAMFLQSATDSGFGSHLAQLYETTTQELVAEDYEKLTGRVTDTFSGSLLLKEKDAKAYVSLCKKLVMHWLERVGIDWERPSGGLYAITPGVSNLSIIAGPCSIDDDNIEIELADWLDDPRILDQGRTQKGWVNS